MVHPTASGGFRPYGVERRAHRLREVVAGRAVCICGWRSRRPTGLPSRAVEEHRRRLTPGSAQDRAIRRLTPGSAQDRAIESYALEGEHTPRPRIANDGRRPTGGYVPFCTTCGRPIEEIRPTVWDHVPEEEF